MIGYLERTYDKVNAIVQEAQRSGIDSAKIHTVSFALFVLFCILTCEAGDETGTGCRRQGQCFLEGKKYQGCRTSMI
jgi:hypothetical protein